MTTDRGALYWAPLDEPDKFRYGGAIESDHGFSWKFVDPDPAADWDPHTVEPRSASYTFDLRDVSPANLAIALGVCSPSQPTIINRRTAESLASVMGCSVKEALDLFHAVLDVPYDPHNRCLWLPKLAVWAHRHPLDMRCQEGL